MQPNRRADIEVRRLGIHQAQRDVRPEVPAHRVLRTCAQVDRYGPNRFVTITNEGVFVTADINASPIAWTQLGATTTPWGAFRYYVRRGPIDFWGLGSYAQPMLVAFNPLSSQIRVAGAADSGLFLTTNGGADWRLITDPMTGGVDPVPHLPRPRYAYFSHESEGAFIYFGSQGRGVWRADVSGVLGLGSIRLARNTATLQCTRYPCRAMQPLQRACKEGLDCPACPDGACPAFVHLTLKGVGEDWSVWLEDSRRQPVEHQQLRQGSTRVLSFRPPEGTGSEPLAGLQLIYEVGEGRPGQRHAVTASVRAAQAPFQSRGYAPAPVARRTPLEWEKGAARAVGGAGTAGQEPPPPPGP
jgi:hypothetical protein